MKILVIHPEGNINYNPNLYGIVEILGEAGHSVTYLARRRPTINQHLYLPGVSVELPTGTPHLGTFLLGASERVTEPDLVLAVDRGIIEAAEVAAGCSAKLALISYEIFFAEEVSREFKVPEIEACVRLSFAIAPDSLRAAKLSEENGIPIDKILTVPVAGRGFHGPAGKLRTMREFFNLELHEKTVLYIGSLADWTGAKYLIESTNAWPLDWKLVLHERFGPSEKNRKLAHEIGNLDRIIISPHPFDSLKEMTRFIASADLGVALYLPTFENGWLGLNLQHIGLSSGKISTYLQHGVPVATHDLGRMTELLKEYGAGFEFSLDAPFVPRRLEGSVMLSCRALFEEQLNLDLSADQILYVIENS